MRGITMNNQKSISYLRDSEVGILTKLSKSTRWRLERDGKFPRKRQLSEKAVGWLSNEIEEWLQSRVTVNAGSVSDGSK
jgi:prophage regulatory protein